MAAMMKRTAAAFTRIALSGRQGAPATCHVAFQTSNWISGVQNNDSIQPPLIQRHFSSPRANNKRSGPLLNEQLVKHIVNNSSAPTTEDIQVRLVQTTPGEAKPTSNVMPLLKALEISSQLGVDLIGINVDNEIPVVKAQDFAKLAYEAQKKAKSNTKANAANSKPMKEVKFKSGIGENDLSRKVQNVLKYLEKGHACQCTLKAYPAALRRDPQVTQKLLQRVLKESEDVAMPSPKIKMNEDQKLCHVILQPVVTKSS